MNILTFDLEVENHKHNKRVAGPFCERNYIVQIGWSINGGTPQEKYYEEYHRENVLPDLSDIDVLVGFNIKFDLLWVWKEPELIKFLKKGGTIYDGQYIEYLLGGATQDVQMCAMNDIAESYGGGCKIDAVKEMWEDGALTSEIPQGLLTDYLVGDGDQIVGDVHNTWLIFRGQMARIKAEHPAEFRTMAKMRMDGLLATTEMEYNGLYVDQKLGEELRQKQWDALQAAQQELEEYIPELPPELIFNWGSPVQKSCLIFGGTVKYSKWVQHVDDNGNGEYAKKKVKQPIFTVDGVTLPVSPDDDNCIKAGALYVLLVPESVANSWEHKGKWYINQNCFKGGKNAGQGKYKQVDVPDLTKPKGAQTDHYFAFKGYVKPKDKWKGSSTDAYDNPLYSTDKDTIAELGKLGLPFTDALSTQTKIAKDLSSYYWTEDKKGKRKGLLTLVGHDGIVHHKLNHTSTVTTRLSSSDPNLQTLPRADKDGDGVAKSEVKRMFSSRFDKGRVAEIDYSQLEVVVQGVLSNDVNLRKDLNNKVDFHCMRLSAKLGRPYEEIWDLHHKQHDPDIGAQRTKAKIFSFQRAYGAGVATLVEETGMPKADVEALIEAENRLYPGVVSFDDRLAKHIDHNATARGGSLFIEGVRFNQKEAHWDSPTGTRYLWKQNIAPKWKQDTGQYTGFKPTERKNYPVQGFGGEIVQAMLGKVFRYFVANDMFDGQVLLTNTVHDCVLLDGIDSDTLNPVVIEVAKILESVPETFNKAFPNTLKIDVPFPVEAEVGNDLFDMSHLPHKD